MSIFFGVYLLGSIPLPAGSRLLLQPKQKWIHLMRHARSLEKKKQDGFSKQNKLFVNTTEPDFID